MCLSARLSSFTNVPYISSSCQTHLQVFCWVQMFYVFIIMLFWVVQPTNFMEKIESACIILFFTLVGVQQQTNKTTKLLLSQYKDDDNNDNNNKLFQQPVPSPLPSIFVPSSFYPVQSLPQQRVQGRVGVGPPASSSFQVEQHSYTPLISTMTSSSSSFSSAFIDCSLQNYSSKTIADTNSNVHAKG